MQSRSSYQSRRRASMQFMTKRFIIEEEKIAIDPPTCTRNTASTYYTKPIYKGENHKEAHPPPSLQEKIGTRRRRVRFQEPIQEIDPPEKDHNLFKTWFSLAEEENIQTHAMHVASMIHEYGFNMEWNPRSYSNVMERTYDHCCPTSSQQDNTRPTKPLSQDLSYWLVQWKRRGTRRGLEMWSLPKLAEKRRNARSSHLNAVVRQQREHQDKQQHTTVPSISKEELLRQVSERHSCSARTFAQILGQVDALAVKEDDARFHGNPAFRQTKLLEPSFRRQPLRVKSSTR